NNLLTENYKWGLELSFPLFLRKARGGIEQVKLEQRAVRLQYQDKQLQIQNKIRATGQLLLTAFNQLGLRENMVRNYQDLLVAENEKFRIGESSIFLLNSREQKLLDAQLKLAKLQIDYQKLAGKLEWAKGNLQ
ncbi:MAG: TolC family protein, partial [Bacteroidota bacterium]